MTRRQAIDSLVTSDIQEVPPFLDLSPQEAIDALPDYADPNALEAFVNDDDAHHDLAEIDSLDDLTQDHVNAFLATGTGLSDKGALVRLLDAASGEYVDHTERINGLLRHTIIKLDSGTEE